MKSAYALDSGMGGQLIGSAVPAAADVPAAAAARQKPRLTPAVKVRARG
jgi:hypothetical protein